MSKGQILLLRILEAAYYYIAEYDSDQAIKKVQADLLKLKDNIMNGHMLLISSEKAWNQLEELDKLKTK